MATIHLERVGDFFNAYNEDAKDMAKALGIPLVSHRNMPMAGVPAHALADWVSDLGKAGFNVVINRPLP